MPDPAPLGPRGLTRFHARILDLESFSEAAGEVARTGSDPEGVGIMTRKARIFPVRLDGVSLRAAPLLKQELLAVGGDSAHARGVADHSTQASEVVLLATWGQYRRLIPKLLRQPFGLSEIGRAIDAALTNRVRTTEQVVAGVHRSFTVGARTLVMGVVNVTPDSFFDGGRFLDAESAEAQALRLVDEGADLVDVGGESTRPGADPVSPDAEWARVGPVVARLHGKLTVPLSIDTRHAEVAEQALSSGADLVNDVEGLRDPTMRRVVARSGAPAILMHLRGTPATMQSELSYSDLRGEVFAWLADALALAEADGVAPGKLLVDPGLGFGKSAEQSLELLAHVGELRSLGRPVVVGASRKSFLGTALGGAEVLRREEAGVAAAVAAALRGADIVRVHDVGPTVRALALADRLRPGRSHDKDLAEGGD